MKQLQIVRIALDTASLDEEDLEALATGIIKTAPQGTLYAQSQTIKDCVTQLDATHTKYKDASSTAIATAAKLETDKQAAADLRSVLLTAIVQLKGLVETSAKSPADVKGAGYTMLDRALSGLIEPPPGVDIFYPKNGHGRAKVTAQETGTRKRYEAQLCLDPLAQNTWADLDGYGRSHWLTGFKSGQVVWVRFRTLRGHEKSDFCAAVSVTIP